MPTPDSPWFFLALIGFYLAIFGILSLVSGWHELSHLFESDGSIDGERFRFRSAVLGSKLFPVSYGNCLTVTIGPSGVALVPLLPFRFMHPRLVIPWTSIERCEKARYWFRECTVVHVAGFSRRLLFFGTVGQKILTAWNGTQERSSA